MVSDTGNATEIVMPQMGADMQEGTLLRWLKHPGDRVERGEAIAEIETDKANVELEAFDAGVLAKTLVEEGAVVPVGDVIALIDTGASVATAQTPPAPAAPQQPEPAQAPPSAAPPQPVEAAPPGGDGAGLESPAVEPDKRQGVERPVGAAPAPSAMPQPERLNAAAERLRVSPVARHLAEQLGVDVSALAGRGPDGRIMRKDVEQAAEAQGKTTHPAAGAETQPRRWVEEARGTRPPEARAPSEGAATLAAPPEVVSETLSPAPQAERAVPSPQPPAPQPQAERRQEQPAPPARSIAPPHPAQPAAAGEVVPFTRMREAIARRMAQSKREAPHYYVTAEVDMTEAMAFRQTLNQAGHETVHVSVNDLIVKASAEVLRRYPPFNAFYSDAGLRMNERINICIAVALPEGLIAPALLDVGIKSLGTIAREAHDLAERARAGGLRAPELNEGTFTISNLGMYGIETLIPIIQPPQSAILGVGAVQDKPAVRDGQIVIRKLMMVALAADHRVTDGAQGGEFLRELKRLLEEPVSLAL
jgi:pyruvate dehydrogenase E2 component (dihydrolipoamide acetyltransferase)